MTTVASSSAAAEGITIRAGDQMRCSEPPVAPILHLQVAHHGIGTMPSELPCEKTEWRDQVGTVTEVYELAKFANVYVWLRQFSRKETSVHELESA